MQEHNQYATRKRIPENIDLVFLKGFLKCGICNHPVTGSHIKRKDINLYYCSAKNGSKSLHSNAGQFIHTKDLEAQVDEFFSLLELDAGVLDEVLERAKEILLETHEAVDRERSRLIKENQRLAKRRQALEVTFLDGDITADTYKRQHPVIESEIAVNTLKIDQMGEKREANVTLFESLVRLAHDLPKAYRESTPQVKMMYLGVFWDHFVLKDKAIIKAVPSKIVISMVNDGLISFNGNNPSAVGLIMRIWLRILEAVSTCFARGEAGYFPYHIVNEHIDAIGVRAV